MNPCKDGEGMWRCSKESMADSRFKALGPGLVGAVWVAMLFVV